MDTMVKHKHERKVNAMATIDKARKTHTKEMHVNQRNACIQKISPFNAR